MIHVFDSTVEHANSGPRTGAIHWSWVTLSGRDARDFLHRLTTVHVNGLDVGQGAPGFFLSAQGKVRAYFTLWRFGPEDYAFEFDAGAHGAWKSELLATIDQYTFAEKIALADVMGLASRWLLSQSAEALLSAIGAPSLKAGQTLAIDEEIRICHHGDIDFGRPWITVWGRPERLDQWMGRTLPGARAIGESDLAAWRVQAARPWVDTEITPTTIPLEAGLTEALAQGKGCYPGQEVIERIISLGAPARRLVRIEGQGTLPSREETILNLAEPAAEVGQVTSVARTGDTSFVALGFVRKIHAKEGLEVRFARAGSQGSITSVAPYAR